MTDMQTEAEVLQACARETWKLENYRTRRQHFQAVLEDFQTKYGVLRGCHPLKRIKLRTAVRDASRAASRVLLADDSSEFDWTDCTNNQQHLLKIEEIQRELAGRQLTQEQLAEYLKVQQHESEEEDKLLTVMRRLLSRVERLHYEYINSVDSSPYQMLKQEVIRIIADYENVSDHMLEILQTRCYRFGGQLQTRMQEVSKAELREQDVRVTTELKEVLEQSNDLRRIFNQLKRSYDKNQDLCCPCLYGSLRRMIHEACAQASRTKSHYDTRNKKSRKEARGVVTRLLDEAKSISEAGQAIMHLDDEREKLKRLSKKELKRDLEQKQATLGLEKMAIQQMNNLLQELERLEVEVRRYWVWSRKDLLVRGIENTLYAFEQLNCSTPREPRQQQHRRGYQV